MVVKIDAADLAAGEQRAEVVDVVGLHRVLAEEGGAAGEGAEELLVEIVAVGQHHERRVLQRRLVHQRAAEEGHQQRLARALGVPDHPAAAVALTGLQDARQRLPDGVELVVAGDLLDRPAALVLEDDEAAQHGEQDRPGEEATDQGFEGERRGLVDQRLAVDRAPAHEAVEVGGDRAVARGDAVGDHRQQVGAEQLGHLVLVGLDLVERLGQRPCPRCP